MCTLLTMKEVSIRRNLTCLLPYDTEVAIKNYSIGPDFKDGSCKQHCLSYSFLPHIYLFIYLFKKVPKSIYTDKNPH